MRNKNGGDPSAGASVSNFHFNLPSALFVMSLLALRAQQSLYWLSRSRGFLRKFLEKH